MPANAPYQCERDVNNEEIFDPIDEEELEEPLADENAADHRAMDVEELIPDVVEEDEPEANEEEHVRKAQIDLPMSSPTKQFVINHLSSRRSKSPAKLTFYMLMPKMTRHRPCITFS